MTNPGIANAHPCPFCGSADLVMASWYVDDDEVDAIECEQCKAGAPIDIWNSRSKQESKPHSAET